MHHKTLKSSLDYLSCFALLQSIKKKKLRTFRSKIPNIHHGAPRKEAQSNKHISVHHGPATKSEHQAEREETAISVPSHTPGLLRRDELRKQGLRERREGAKSNKIQNIIHRGKHVSSTHPIPSHDCPTNHIQYKHQPRAPTHTCPPRETSLASPSSIAHEK